MASKSSLRMGAPSTRRSQGAKLPIASGATPAPHVPSHRKASAGAGWATSGPRPWVGIREGDAQREWHRGPGGWFKRRMRWGLLERVDLRIKGPGSAMSVLDGSGAAGTAMH